VGAYVLKKDTLVLKRAGVPYVDLVIDILHIRALCTAHKINRPSGPHGVDTRLSLKQKTALVPSSLSSQSA
jgi:hypothetical protein